MPVSTVLRVAAGSLLLLSMPAGAQQPDLRLVDAVRRADQAAVRTLLDSRHDVNARQPDGATALHWAAYLDDVATADLLLDAGARAEAANELGVTPLQLACENGNATLVRRLLAAGADANAALRGGETALMTAARTGSAGAVAALLAHGADVNARETRAGQTALMWAVSQRHPAVVRTLLAAGADVSARTHVRPVATASSPRTGAAEGVAVIDEGGFTPLLFAARQGDLASARLLLAAGADANDTAPAGTSALVVAAHSGHGALAAWLVEQGADPNAAGAGYTALHAAILRGDADLVSTLLAHGADPHAPLRNGSPHARYGKFFALEMRLTGATPFFLAAKYAEADIMRRLAAAGADPRARLAGGVTPLMAAAGMLTPGFVQAGNDRRGRAIDTAEMELALSQDPDRRRLMNSGIAAVQAAVELGADVNAVHDDGDTALHLAAHHGFNSVVRYLVGRGADLHALNARGQTPLDRALGTRGRVPAKNPVTDTEISTADLLRALGAREQPPSRKEARR